MQKDMDVVIKNSIKGILVASQGMTINYANVNILTNELFEAICDSLQSNLNIKIESPKT